MSARGAGAQQPGQQPLSQTRVQAVQTPNYFSYGQQNDIDSVLGGFNTTFDTSFDTSFMPQETGAYGSMFGNPAPDVSQSIMFKRGGMATPLMAQGGTRHGQNAHGALNVVHAAGKPRVDYRQGDAVTGQGDGQSDDIPAMLADGEFVVPADVVSALGNGSTKAGSDKLYEMMHEIRKRARSTGVKDLPPPAKSPLQYLKKRR